MKDGRTLVRDVTPMQAVLEPELLSQQLLPLRASSRVPPDRIDLHHSLSTSGVSVNLFFCCACFKIASTDARGTPGHDCQE